MSNCLFCDKKIPMSKVFCSRSCKENYFEMVAIQVPKPFLKRIFFLCTVKQREKEIEEFGNRHGWHIDLLKSKINDLAIEYGYIKSN